MPDPTDLQSRLQHLDSLLHQVDHFADPAAQAHMREMVQALLDLHGEGFERVVSLMTEAGAAGLAILDACARDDVVAGLLLLHGLHPMDIATRVNQALEQVRPLLRSHGGNVELLGVDDGIVRLRLVGSCHGCPSSTLTMKQTIEEAIIARAPDVTAVQVEGGVESPPTTASGPALVVLPVL